MQISPSCQIPELLGIYNRVFENRKCFFIDIGAFDGYVFSNCWGLAEDGWRGIFIEPNPDLFDLCNQRYKNNPKVTTIKYAIGDENKENVTLYTGGTLTTTSLESLELYNQIEWSHGLLNKDRFIKSSMRTLNSIIGEFGEGYMPDVISIDTEGNELDVLKGFNIRFYLPKIVIVETHELSKDTRLSRNFPAIDQYFNDTEIYTKAFSDEINTIYERIQLFR